MCGRSEQPFGASRAQYVFRDAGYVRLEIGPGPGEDDDLFAILYHCMRNSRATHMLSLGNVKLVSCCSTDEQPPSSAMTAPSAAPTHSTVSGDRDESDDDGDDDDEDALGEGTGILHYPTAYEPGLRFMIEHAGKSVRAGELAAAMPGLALEDAHNILFGLVNEQLVVVQ
jgi:hypothetical protein